MKHVALVLCLVLCVPAAELTARGQVSSSPELPRVYLDSSYPATAGTTLQVAAGGDLQGALNAANPGDTVVLAAGATFTGNFVLPAKSGNGWIVIRTSALGAGFPAEGTRVTPAHSSLMPKIVSPSPAPALATAPGAHNYRLVGLELGLKSNVTQNYGLLTLGDASSAQNSMTSVPRDLVVDRCYVRGNPTANVRRGIALNSASTSVVDSYISEIHEVGADTQAICGWNGPGPYKIVNNYLEAAGENVMFGGADPSIPNLVPSDIEIRRNHLFKPLSWKSDHPTFAGITWTVKNIFELKNAQRVLVDGNTFENNWAAAQNGFAILFTVRNQDGTAPWSVVQDVTFTNNIVRRVGCGVNVLGTDYIHPSEQTRRIRLANNLFEEVGFGGIGRLFQIIDGADSIEIEHNTAFQTGAAVMADEDPSTNFRYKNNLTSHGDLGIFGSGIGTGASALQFYFPGYVCAGNALVGGNGSVYPSGNYFPSTVGDVGFANYSAGDYRLTSSSQYCHAATDGGVVGANIDAIEAAIAGSAPPSIPAPTPNPDPDPEPPPSGDTTPPVFTNLTVASVAETSASITWDTDEASTTGVEYGTTSALGTVYDSARQLDRWHPIEVANLTPGTRYYVRARSRDAAGNLAVSSSFTFVTGGGTGEPEPEPEPPSSGDTTPPVFSNVTVASVTTSSGSITWDTNEASTTGVEYGTTSALGTVYDSARQLDRWHPITITGLAPGTLYHFRTRSRDAAGNLAVSATYTFTTAGSAPPPPSDTTPPTFANVTVASVTSSGASITWDTNEASTTSVEYGTTSALGTVLDAARPLDRWHSVELTSLSAATQYRFRVRSRDAAGNLAVSSIYTFTTLPSVPADPGVLQSVAWTHLVRCAVDGTSLYKLSGRGNKPDATAASSQRLYSGDGYFEFTVDAATTERWVGVGRDSLGADPSAIDYSVRLNARGKATIYERGIKRVDQFSYAAGDVFRIAIAGGVVTYTRNGAVVYTSAQAPIYPIYANAGLVTLDGTVRDAKLFAATTGALGY